MITCCLRFFLILLFIYIPLNASEGFNAEEAKYGRLLISAPTFYFDDSKDPINRTAYFRNIEQQVDEKRASMAKKDLTEVPETYLSVATFGFEFFDNDGNSLNASTPFHFGHSMPGNSVEALSQPYFFLSGRFSSNETHCHSRLCSCLLDHSSHIYDIRNMKKEMQQFVKSTKKMIDEFKGKNNNANCHHSLRSLLISQEGILNQLECQISNYDCFLSENISDFEKRFIENIVQRYSVATGLNSSEVVIGRDCIKLIQARTETIKYKNPFDKKSKQTIEHIAFEENERYFTHAEQVALTRFELEFADFIKSVLLMMQPADKEKVSSVVMYIYSRDTICARCSVSIIVDFLKKGGIKDKIVNAIKESVDIEIDLNFGIIAAAKIEHHTEDGKEAKIPPFDYEGLRETQKIDLSYESTTKNYIHEWFMPPEEPQNMGGINLFKTDKFSVFSLV